MSAISRIPSLLIWKMWNLVSSIFSSLMKMPSLCSLHRFTKCAHISISNILMIIWKNISDYILQSTRPPTPYSGDTGTVQTGDSLGVRTAAFRSANCIEQIYQDRMKNRWCSLPMGQLPVGSYLLKGGRRSDCCNSYTTLCFLYIQQKHAAAVSSSSGPALWHHIS